MSIKLYFFESGKLKSEKHLFTKDRGGGVPFEVPVPFFLIQYKGKNILFDTGNAIEVADNPEKHWGDIVNVYYPKMAESEFVANQLKNVLDISADEIDYVILSHLHLDHAGGVGAFKNATYITHEKEYEWAFNPDCSQKSAYIKHDISKEVNWLKIDPELQSTNTQDVVLNSFQNRMSERPCDPARPNDGGNGSSGRRIGIATPNSFDLFNDGAIMIYPTPGHTPGHLSVLVNLENSKPMFLTSDSCYTEENLNDNIPPGLVWGEEESIKTLEFIKGMQAQGAEIIVGHDPIAWKKFKKAPEFYS